MKITSATPANAVRTVGSKADAISRTEAAREVAPQVATPTADITRFGSVSSVGASDGSFFTVTLTPGTGAKEYIIGDPYGLIAAAVGKTFTEPTGASGTTPAALKASTQQGIALKGVHYQVTVSKNQFSNPLRMIMGNYDGSFASVPINVVGTTRPDWQNDKLVVIEFKNNITLDSRNALTLTVTAGESVDLTFFVAAFGF
jgi:hypothetical protein